MDESGAASSSGALPAAASSSSSSTSSSSTSSSSDKKKRKSKKHKKKKSKKTKKKDKKQQKETDKQRDARLKSEEKSKQKNLDLANSISDKITPILNQIDEYMAMPDVAGLPQTYTNPGLTARSALEAMLTEAKDVIHDPKKTLSFEVKDIAPHAKQVKRTISVLTQIVTRIRGLSTA